MKCKDGKKHYWKDGWICEKCGIKRADHVEERDIPSDYYRAIDDRLSNGLSEDEYDEPPEGYSDFEAYQKSKGWCST